MSIAFFSNCSTADEEHLMECDCCNKIIDQELIMYSKDLSKDVLHDDDKLLNILKTERFEIMKTIGETNKIKNVKCKHEISIVKDTLKNFEKFDLTIPTYGLIVNSVINQVLISYRLSIYIGSHGLTTITHDKFGNSNEIISPMIDVSSKVDKLIIDACDKMHKLKYGEKSTVENISTKPMSIDEIFNDAKIIELEQKRD